MLHIHEVITHVYIHGCALNLFACFILYVHACMHVPPRFPIIHIQACTDSVSASFRLQGKKMPNKLAPTLEAEKAHGVYRNKYLTTPTHDRFICTSERSSMLVQHVPDRATTLAM